MFPKHFKLNVFLSDGDSLGLLPVHGKAATEPKNLEHRIYVNPQWPFSGLHRVKSTFTFIRYLDHLVLTKVYIYVVREKLLTTVNHGFNWPCHFECHVEILHSR